MRRRWVAQERAEFPLLHHFTMFIDGISDVVDYSQIRELFAHIGRVGKMFVQRHRKVGRRFCLGSSVFFPGHTL